MADRKLEKLLEETWNPKEFSEFLWRILKLT